MFPAHLALKNTLRIGAQMVLIGIGIGYHGAAVRLYLPSLSINAVGCLQVLGRE